MSASLPITTKKRLDEIADERGCSRSSALTQVVAERDQYLDERDAARAEIEQLRAELEVEQERREQAEQADDSGAGRASTFADQLAAAALVIAPVAYAVTTPAVAGGLLAVVGAWLAGTLTPLGGWVADRVTNASERVAEAGGVGAFFLTALLDRSEGVDDPDTLVEQATRLDVVATLLVWLAVFVSLPVAVGNELIGAAATVELLTPYGVLLLLLGVPVLIGLAALALWLSVVATLAVGHARRRSHNVIETLRREVE